MPSSHLILCRPLLLTLLKVGYFSLASFKIFCAFDTLKFYICEDLHLSYLGSLNFLEYKVIDLQYFVEIPWVFLLLSSPGIPILLMLRVFNGVPHFAEAVFIFFFNFYWSIFTFIYSFFFKFTWCWSLSSEFLKLYFSTPKFPFGSFFFFCCTTQLSKLPWPVIKPVSPAVEVWHLNHWTTSKVPPFLFNISLLIFSCDVTWSSYLPLPFNHGFL